jgi:hypothetical protein
MKSSITLVLVLVALSIPIPICAQVVVTSVVLAGEEALDGMENWVLDMKREQNRAVRADRVRDKLKVARDQYSRSLAAVDTEIRRLQVNPEGNRREIANLQRIQKSGGELHERLKLLTSYADSDTVLINALRSGNLEKTLRQARDMLNGYKREVAAVRERLDRPGGGFPGEAIGSVSIRALESLRGTLSFFMEDYVPGIGWTEVALRPGVDLPIRKLPIVIRASLRDDEKKNLIAGAARSGYCEAIPGSAIAVGATSGRPACECMAGLAWDSTYSACVPAADHGTPQSKIPLGSGPLVEFLRPNAGAILTGQVFRYRGQSGEFLMTTQETYTWDIDVNTQRLGGALRRSSSPAAKQDIIEIHPAQTLVQNLVLRVEATSTGWRREGTFRNKPFRQDLPPRNNSAAARLVISVLPR